MSDPADIAAVRAGVAALTHPVYAVAGLPIHAIGADPRSVNNGAFAQHGTSAWQITVQTAPVPLEDAADGVRGSLLPLLLDQSPMTSTSEAELRAQLVARHQAADRAVAAIPVAVRIVQVDGVGVEFAFGDAGEWWAAAGHHAGVRLIVWGHHAPSDDLALVSVADPVAHAPS
jgi:hypothetical protein